MNSLLLYVMDVTSRFILTVDFDAAMVQAWVGLLLFGNTATVPTHGIGNWWEDVVFFWSIARVHSLQKHWLSKRQLICCLQYCISLMGKVVGPCSCGRNGYVMALDLWERKI